MWLSITTSLQRSVIKEKWTHNNRTMAICRTLHFYSIAPLTVLSSWPSQLDVTCCEKRGRLGCGRVNDNHNTTAARERIKFHIGPNVTSHLGPRNSGVGPCGERRGPELQTIQIHLDSLFNKSGI